MVNRSDMGSLAGRHSVEGERSNRKAGAHSNHAARRIKLRNGGFFYLWKGAGASLEIWSWAQQGAREKQKTWQLRREAL
ncbi:MAG: hypothetical protein E8D41_04810 [Nitrospira sp.]|nr:MAG: hypothetical protein E8D41_04810 [Nitrospira sp.]